MLEEAEIKKYLKMAFWDYNYSPEEIYNVLYHEAQMPYLNKERIYRRLLETFSWYKLLALLPLSQINEALSEEIIQKLRNEPLRKRYRHVARILRETTIPPSK